MKTLIFIVVALTLLVGWYINELHSTNQAIIRSNAELVSANKETNESVEALLREKETTAKIHQDRIADYQAREKEKDDKIKDLLNSKSNDPNGWASTQYPDSAICLLSGADVPDRDKVCAESSSGGVDERNTPAKDHPSNTDGLIYTLELESALGDCNRDKASLREWFERNGGAHGNDS